jgi:two-component system OmpR family response regulator
MSTQLQSVLYIDDEQDILDVAQMCLETVGDLKVTCSTNSNDALETVREVMPDLIMLDVMMPETSGPTILSELRKHPEFDDIPVIFLTARASDDDIASYVSLGAVSVISKPFDPMEISNLVLSAWDKAHEQ